MSDTIYLGPDLFMALGLSAEAHGGVGSVSYMEHPNGDVPFCGLGHALFVDDSNLFNIRGWSALQAEMLRAGFQPCKTDDLLREAGRGYPERVPFTEWCRIVGVDVSA